MPTALIADDEPHLAAHLQAQLVALWPELQLMGVARNGIEAAALITAHAPDIAFLDIKMPGLSGLEVAQGIEGGTRVVFVTAYDEFAVQAFEQAALDHLLKPITSERLARTVERLRQALSGAASVSGSVSASASAQRRCRRRRRLKRLPTTRAWRMPCSGCCRARQRRHRRHRRHRR